jgi:hypothetical protein
MSDLRDWLRGINLEQYADAFETNDIDLDILRLLAITACAPATRP